MKRKTVVEFGVLLLTIGGGGLIAITQVKDQLDVVFPMLTGSFYTVCLVVGFVLGHYWNFVDYPPLQHKSQGCTKA